MRHRGQVVMGKQLVADQKVEVNQVGIAGMG